MCIESCSIVYEGKIMSKVLSKWNYAIINAKETYLHVSSNCTLANKEPVNGREACLGLGALRRHHLCNFFDTVTEYRLNTVYIQ